MPTRSRALPLKTRLTRLPKCLGGPSRLAVGLATSLAALSGWAAAPVVQSVDPVLTMQHVRVTFASAVDAATASTAGNYSFVSGGATVQSATVISPTVVELYTSDLSPSAAYGLQIGGVQEPGGSSMTTTQLNFTAPPMAISPVRYDAGTTTTQPDGPPDPGSLAAGSWLLGRNGTGLSVGAVTDDNGTGWQAWNLSDASSAGPSTVYYSLPINQPASAWWGRTNGWRIVIVYRFVDNFGYTSPSQGLLCFNPGAMYGYQVGIDGGGQLILQPRGSSTIYPLPGDAYGYHTNMTVYDPVKNTVALYFDGQCIVDNAPQSSSSNSGLIIGSTDSSVMGSINYHLIQMDVVRATRPTVLVNPTNVTLVGQGKLATFTADFGPFCNAFRWLSNGVLIAGATTTSYTTGPQTSANNGDRYSCLALNALGNVETAPATVTVVDDAPKVQTVSAVLTLQHIRVNFSEAVDPAQAANLSNYALVSDPLTLQRATLIEPGVVELLTSATMATGSVHTLHIANLYGNGGSSMMVATQLDFTVPRLGTSAIRYDAGTVVSRPAGPPDPATLEGGLWTDGRPNMGGISAEPVLDDNGTGLNAWNVTDGTMAGGSTAYYYITMGPATSLPVLATNAWRVVTVCRLADSFSSGEAAHQFLYWIGSKLYGVAWSVDGSGQLHANVVGGSGYLVSSEPFSYHTNIIAYDPAQQVVSVYFDNTLLTGNCTGNSGSVNGQILFGSASSSGMGAMNYNRIQLDVVNATAPVVLQQPASTTNGVGQRATFTAAFSPFAYGYRWLSNGIAIAGATNNSYTTGLLDPSYNGAQYVCRALNGFAVVQTAPATLTVTTDTTPPTIVSVKSSLLGDRLVIVFSEPIQASYATNLANYVWLNPGVTNIAATMLDSQTVELRAGPFVGGNNYTVQVSNIRDTSNLLIVPNSPAVMLAPTLSVIAGYDAGTTTTAPAGPPDPMTAAGGNWLLLLGTDPGVSTNAVIDDNGTGWNAWNVTDMTTAGGQYALYYLPLPTSLEDTIRPMGWVLTVRCRAVDYYGTAGATSAGYFDYKNNRYTMGFNLNDSYNFVTSLDQLGSFTVTSDSSGTDYHLHQFLYDPVSQTSSYYCDGSLVVANIPKSPYGAGSSQIIFGAAASADKGAVNFNLVQLASLPLPYLGLTRDGGNAQVAYRGILEMTTELSQPTVWTAVATNATAGTNLYTLPLNSHAQQYFRVKQQLP